MIVLSDFDFAGFSWGKHRIETKVTLRKESDSF